MVDPGIVNTNIMHELPRWLEWLAHFVLKLLVLLQNPQTGASAVIDAALAPEVRAIFSSMIRSNYSMDSGIHPVCILIRVQTKPKDSTVVVLHFQRRVILRH